MDTSYMPKVEAIERSWYVIDASGLVLGRLSAQIASILRGKMKPIFIPHVDCGDYVIVVNCDKILLTGRKIEKKTVYRYTGHIGNLKAIKYLDLYKNNPVKMLEMAVKGMLPKNSLGRKQFLRLKAVKGTEHGFTAQKPEVWEYIRKEKKYV
ncbi:MAG: 50S ribosomal protein L13 [Candidatus Improbicoccus pseudotrichonymphae]|uniref:Large ribosomal subunit protein uL13 n=1 Tax=Candidatus Improbicoccus pseudotrichonymphae TaxID=3033792 RepID=A0AA48IAF4_9FIRM|nr:MAG: 50S ribosomal protein L13 [Candidatus Improbicoccus pseudotrichonymphae]